MTTLARRREPTFSPFTDQSAAVSDIGAIVRARLTEATKHVRATATDWRRSAKGLIEQVVDEAATEDWDGEGARALSNEVRLFAHAFIDAMPSHLQAPDVTPEHDGHLAFTWDQGKGRVFSVSVSPTGTLHYAGLLGGGRKSHGVERFGGAVPSSILTAVEDISD